MEGREDDCAISVFRLEEWIAGVRGAGGVSGSGKLAGRDHRNDPPPQRLQSHEPAAASRSGSSHPAALSLELSFQPRAAGRGGRWRYTGEAFALLSLRVLSGCD